MFVFMWENFLNSDEMEIQKVNTNTNLYSLFWLEGNIIRDIYFHSIESNILTIKLLRTLCINARNCISCKENRFTYTYNKRHLNGKERMEATWFTKEEVWFPVSNRHIIRFWRSVGKFVLFYICHICICISITQ